MKLLRYFLPRSLIARVYALYSATLLLFVGSGLVLFYQYQYNEAIEEAQRSATMLIEVAAQVVYGQCGDRRLRHHPAHAG